jgi:hypothetical protein
MTPADPASAENTSATIRACTLDDIAICRTAVELRNGNNVMPVGA